MSAVDLDLLADYVGGALDGTPEHDRIARLVTDDPAWRSAAADLRSALLLVDADLATLAAAAEPMPDDIAARFDTLLASPEFATSPAPPARSGVGERTLSRDARGARPARRGWRRWAAPVAVAAGVLALAGIVLPLGPLATTVQEAATGMSAQDAPAVAPADGRTPISASGTDYLREQLNDSGVMTQKSAPSASAARTGDAQLFSSPMPGLDRLSGSADALASCLAAIRTALPGTVTGADFARFEGRPALVVTVDTTSGGWWFVAGPGCGLNGADELFRSPRN
ncbi:hypothetical protein [Catellatospora citrea]|uniref:Uncharacterized protein n=1 Tax=Catellatospora citrea TaxID=53366 RepID=A0A8J3P2G5_9ACTN|nr:hypothetical protein [Catellatospora citrea]RKE08894.1 hypothetical protein C8E86_3770 [Catellatospora citrea]GIG01233.1 hypothetical protein Cci01nite_63260 [Catellatospora citrea]